MPKHREKREVLRHNDHILNIGPAGRNLFITREKQMKSRQARRLKVMMRVVVALGILVAALGVGLFAAFYMLPYFRAEISLDSSGGMVGEDLSSLSQVDLPTYNSMGLPVYSNDISMFVINQSNPQDATYVPETVEVEGVQVEVHMVNALEMLVEAAKEDGLALVFSQGYVSYEEQDRLYNAEVDRLMEEENMTTVMARTQARLSVPRAGECDQQTGLCLRVDANPETFEDSRTCSWLRNNMGKYGFIFRYPEGKEEYTGCSEDLTVIRYVGSENATAMQQRSMCLEEYLSYLASQG